MSRTKLIIGTIGSLIILWISWNTYSYFFSKTAPSLAISGINTDETYKENIQCTICAKDNYKISNLSVGIDNNQIFQEKIGKTSIEYPFEIPVKNLENGNHELSIKVENGTFRKDKTLKKVNFNVDNTPLEAEVITEKDNLKALQGRTLHIKFKTNKPIKSAKAILSLQETVCTPKSKHSLIHECFIPIDCEEAPNNYPLIIEIEDQAKNLVKLQTNIEIVEAKFKKSNLKLDPTKVKEENKVGLSERELEAELEQLSKKSPNKKLWQGQFVSPIEIKDQNQITTSFGTIRVTQERGLKRHNAIDLYGPPKSVVWATQDGIVVLKNRYCHSGNTVVVDHGLGVISLFFHLDTFADIEVGEKIKKGNPVGTIGKTGYATGYHLHWEMRINNITVDPMQWINKDF